MKSTLSMRQNKILQLLRNRRDYMTSDEIAKVLNVSSKTVRTDIADINFNLNPQGIFIDSVKSKGFVLRAQDPAQLKKFTKDNQIFTDRTDRVYYLAVLLCTNYEPIDLYDLEDEMAVSSSTLSGDITAFKNRFTYVAPFIELKIVNNAVILEADERKRRFILAKLLIENWDYNSTGNVYYESDFIDSKVFETVNSITGNVLYRHGVFLDDYHLIFFNLFISIAVHQILDGHPLTSGPLGTSVHPEARECCTELFGILEDELSVHFPEDEILDACFMISEFYSFFTNKPSPNSFSPKFKESANQFIKRAYETFGIDLSGDDEFYYRLLIFISQLNLAFKDMTVRDTPDHIKQHLFVEYDIAILIHKILAGSYKISEDDILYLTWAVSGAFYRHFQLHSEERFETVVLCHMSANSMWSLENALTDLFGGYLNIKDVIPVYQKDFYDFSNTRLILSTVDKQISSQSGYRFIEISPYLSKENIHTINDCIRNLKIEKLYSGSKKSIRELLGNAFVHEKMLFSSQYNLIEFMCEDFTENGIFTSEHLPCFLEHESISSFAFNPAVLLLYSTIPASETRLSVLTLDHRIMWNKHKIRIVFMVSLTKEDMKELFYLQDVIYHKNYSVEKLKNLKTLEEIREFYKDY